MAKNYLTPDYELELMNSGKYSRVVGIDEVGRGCWAGPVAVGAYIFEINSPKFENVIDSKMLSIHQREVAYQNLSTHKYRVVYSDIEQIDKVGIGKAVEN